MIPLKRSCPLTSSVVEIFLGLRGEAREKAIATGNYDKLPKAEREPGCDDDIDPLSLASQA